MSALQGTYKFKATGNVYFVENEVDMKHPASREWVRAVVYSCTQHVGYIYCREKEDFLKKFERVE